MNIVKILVPQLKNVPFYGGVVASRGLQKASANYFINHVRKETLYERALQDCKKAGDIMKALTKNYTRGPKLWNPWLRKLSLGEADAFCSENPCEITPKKMRSYVCKSKCGGGKKEDPCKKKKGDPCKKKKEDPCKKQKEDPCKKKKVDPCKKKKEDPCKKKKEDPCKKKEDPCKKKKDPCKKKEDPCKKKKDPCKKVDPCKKKKVDPCKKKKEDPCKKKKEDSCKKKKEDPCKKKKEDPCKKKKEDPCKKKCFSEVEDHDVLQDVNILDCEKKHVVEKYFGDCYKNKTFYSFNKHAYYDMFVYMKSKRNKPPSAVTNNNKDSSDDSCDQNKN